jgi:protein-S-isoprenylcysteine O-methyltransferase Ste14
MMDGDSFTADKAWQWAAYLWRLLMVVWIVMWFGMKKAKKLETWGERAQHELFVLLGFWLLFAGSWNWGWPNYRLLPNVSQVWAAGLVLTAAGIAISLWARLSLGSNWSGTVTLKQDHQLVSTGLYRWIRHPIYTGILLAMFGTAMIRGQLVGWLGTAMVLTAFYFKARREEKFLREEFGPGFDEHVRRTGMFLPKLTL